MVVALVVVVVVGVFLAVFFGTLAGIGSGIKHRKDPRFSAKRMRCSYCRAKLLRSPKTGYASTCSKCGKVQPWASAPAAKRTKP